VAGKRAAMEAAVAKLTAAGDKNVHLLQGHELYGPDSTAAGTATFNNVRKQRGCCFVHHRQQLEVELLLLAYCFFICAKLDDTPAGH
jgi:hypothetical protein